MSADPPRRRRWRRWILGALLVAIWGADLSRAPDRQWSARAEIGMIHAYRAAVSPWLARSGVRCRFTPTCSHYAEAVIRRDGALVGTARALWRVARCGPWTPAGTADPPLIGEAGRPRSVQ